MRCLLLIGCLLALASAETTSTATFKAYTGAIPFYGAQVLTAFHTLASAQANITDAAHNTWPAFAKGPSWASDTLVLVQVQFQGPDAAAFSAALKTTTPQQQAGAGLVGLTWVDSTQETNDDVPSWIAGLVVGSVATAALIALAVRDCRRAHMKE